MDKIKYRVLLSEILPYETPLFFDNFGFYEKIIKEGVDKKWMKDQLAAEYSGTIPFNYNVKRNCDNGVRCLSVIHPIQQLDIVEFYKENDVLLVKYSTDSPFSLRHINGIAKLYYDASHELIVDYDKTNVEIDDDEKEENVYVSYFTYREIDRMYKFFKDMPMFRLEQKYSKMRKLDVAKCFYHIYTHSITWAIAGKAYAKANKRNDCLANRFDSLMRHCNYDETNGIVVGPEVSRIFAEIIFRRIDFNVLERLKSLGIILGRDYEIRRYVDDMMVFSHDDNILDKIESTIKEELEQYKLYVNPAKTITSSRPFGTPLSCCKQELLEEYEQLKNNIGETKEPPYKTSLKFFRKFRTMVSAHSLEYGELNRMMLSLLAKMIRHENFGGEDPATRLKSWLTVVDIAFYLFTLDMSATASLRLCRIILQANEIISNVEPDISIPIKEKLSSEMHRVLNIHLNTRLSELTPIEIVNPLLAMKSIGIDVCDIALIRKLYHIEENDTIDHSRLNYFDICCLMMFMQNKPEYAEVKKNLLEAIEERFKTDATWKQKAELVLLLLDMMACPYIDNKSKNKIILASGLCNNSNMAANKCKNLCGRNQRWFFDWSMSPTALDYYLKKKEYRPTYE